MAEQGDTSGRKRGYAGTWPPRAAAPVGGLAPSRPAFWPPLIETLREWARAEAGAGRLLPWVPVAFGTGIAFYFAADHEPVLSVAAVVAIALCAVGGAAAAAKILSGRGDDRSRRGGLCDRDLEDGADRAWRAGAADVFGVADGLCRDPRHPRAHRPFCAARRHHGKRARNDKARARAAVGEEGHGARGRQLCRIEGAAVAAAHAGAAGQLRFRPRHVFRRHRRLRLRDGRDQDRGAARHGGGLRLRYSAFMQGLRDAIDARIRTTLEGDKRAIATALLTGRRDAISPPVNDAMFISGLGHVLSISGYHMAVVAGVVFFAVRALLALFPALTVGYAIKKWSAAAALVAAAFYLLLSGAEVATQRSFFMTAVVLIAVMVDRRAITFRTLAVAALIVLTVAPEALVHPSFQMSFAATLGLVALVQIGMPRLFATPDHTATARVALWGGREITMLLLASLVAGLATMPYAAFHFHRVTPYGVLANLAAMPVVSAVVMPAGLLGLVAMPFGFDRPVLGDHGRRHRLDDRGDAMGRGVARRGRPGAGVRHRPADRGQSRHHPARAVAHAAALVGRRAGAGGGAVGGEGAAAGYPDLRRRPQCRRPRRGWTAASDACGQGLQGCLPAEGVAGGGCRCANGG